MVPAHEVNLNQRPDKLDPAREAAIENSLSAPRKRDPIVGLMEDFLGLRPKREPVTWTSFQANITGAALEVMNAGVIEAEKVLRGGNPLRGGIRVVMRGAEQLIDGVIVPFFKRAKQNQSAD